MYFKFRWKWCSQNSGWLEEGGGPASSKTLNKLENQLMDLISWTTVAGIAGLPQGGIAPIEIVPIEIAPLEIDTVEILEPLLDVTIVGEADGNLEPKSKKRLRVDTEEPVPRITNKQVSVEDTNTPRSQNKKCEYNLSAFVENQKEIEDRRNAREEMFLEQFIEFKEITKNQLSVLEDISKALQPK
ncbi:hypothetical protein CBL_20151 [Carabus blaptoides fortunei]